MTLSVKKVKPLWTRDRSGYQEENPNKLAEQGVLPPKGLSGGRKSNTSWLGVSHPMIKAAAEIGWFCGGARKERKKEKITMRLNRTMNLAGGVRC